jgi:hypothetical protein
MVISQWSVVSSQWLVVSGKDKITEDEQLSDDNEKTNFYGTKSV